MTERTRQVLTKLLAVTAVSQMSPVLIVELQTAARELLDDQSASKATDSAAPEKASK